MKHVVTIKRTLSHTADVEITDAANAVDATAKALAKFAKFPVGFREMPNNTEIVSDEVVAVQEGTA